MASPYASPFGDPQGFGDWMNLLQNTNSVGYDAYKNDPNSMFGAYTNFMGGQGPNSFLKWLTSQYSRYYGQYSTIAGTNPTYQFSDYLKTINPGQDYSNSSYWDRGDRPNTFAPSMRMVMPSGPTPS